MDQVFIKDLLVRGIIGVSTIGNAKSRKIFLLTLSYLQIYPLPANLMISQIVLITRQLRKKRRLKRKLPNASPLKPWQLISPKFAWKSRVSLMHASK